MQTTAPLCPTSVRSTSRFFFTGIALVVLVPSGAGAPAQSISSTLHGDEENDIFGGAVDLVGDVNGDGFGDVLVGIRGDDENGASSGSVRVYSGEWVLRTALSEPPASEKILYEWHGDWGPTTRFGSAVAGGGDVDGDGIPDLIVGAKADDNLDEATAVDGGSVRVFSGADGGTLATFVGEAHEGLGSSVGWADVNGDGFADVLAGAVGYHISPSQFRGWVRVFSGEWVASTAAGLDPATPQVLHHIEGLSGDDYFGSAVAGLGDLDGDGRHEFACGARFGGEHGGGYAQVFSGAGANLLFSAHGDQAGARFGRALANAGDVDADGRDDLVVGAWSHDTPDGSDAGLARVYSGTWIAHASLGPVGAEPVGSPLLFSFKGDSAADRLGFSVAGAGDTNADGYDDVIVGGYQTGGKGFARVYSGRTGRLLQTHEGSAAGDGFGASVSGAGDLNADGLDDLVIGSEYELNEQGDPAGSARVAFSWGRSVCDALPSSTGEAARMMALGSPSLAADDLVLRAEPVPAATQGLFVGGSGLAQPLPFHDGLLCIDTQDLVRLAVASSSGDVLSVKVDLANRAAFFTPGTTWDFQCWFRDAEGGGSGANLSDALRVQLIN